MCVSTVFLPSQSEYVVILYSLSAMFINTVSAVCAVVLGYLYSRFGMKCLQFVVLDEV
jgi:hypothetical protein